jgi:hypothetical protein
MRNMARIPEQRLSARLAIRSEVRDAQLEWREVRLLDLSPEGARVEHTDSFPEGQLCFLDLPRALGGIRLQGQVIWSEVAVRQAAAKALEWTPYRSGMRFTQITPAQRAELTAALERLKADREK